MYNEIAQCYFQAFNDQNLNAIGEMFADGIVLRDWELNVSGKADVLSANQNIFERYKKTMRPNPPKMSNLQPHQKPVLSNVQNGQLLLTS